MKFGKDLKQYTQAGWEADYIDYKGLKLILKKLEDGVSRADMDAEFFPALEKELEKVNDSFMSKTTEFEKLLEELKPPDESSDAGAGSRSRADSNLQGRLKAEHALLEKRFYAAYHDLGRLQTYTWINRQGFSKIMKKYDKRNNLRGTGTELGPDFEKRLEKEVFCGSHLEVLLEQFKACKPQSGVHAPRSELRMLCGTANPDLAEEIAARVGVPVTPTNIGRFADGECSVQLLENVRNADVYIIQPTCPPVNDNLMELLLTISAVRRASAQRVTAVVPYYGYARQDRKERSRVPISAADVAKMMEAVGVDRVISVDLHCGQIQGFFGPRTPVDNLFASPIALSFFQTRSLQNTVVVSPDAGGVARAKMFKEGLEACGLEVSLAVIIKQRVKAGEVASTNLVGDVTNADAIIVDDMIDTAGTLCAAANELKTFGAKRVFAFATHGLFNGPAADRIEKCALEEVVVANTIPLPPEVAKKTRKIRQVSVGKLLAEAILCTHTGESISSLFDLSKGSTLLA